MKKATAEEIKTNKKKEKEDRQVKQIAKLGSIIEWTTQKTVEKHARA